MRTLSTGRLMDVSRPASEEPSTHCPSVSTAMSSDTAGDGVWSNHRTLIPSNRHGSSIDDMPAPPYSETYREVELNQGGFDTIVQGTDDGRIDININEGATRLSSVVGSRGDVQPFIALGQVLKSTYGHRVRLATHPAFKGFVEEKGLEFFSIGGDPTQLMANMVKNPGLMPGTDALRRGDISKRRKEISTIISGRWRSCFEAGDASFSDVVPFVADAIIANPPSFAHVHCAEKLGIPLHLMFTMPWSPTQAFPHPLANIQSSNADASVTNYMSYLLVEMMTWQGLGDIINKSRERSLGHRQRSRACGFHNLLLPSSSSHEGLRSHRGSTSEGHRRSTTCQSVRNADNDSTSSPDQVCLDTVVNASRTAAKLFNMSLKAPMNLTLAIAKGFHNAPLLYGDNTRFQGCWKGWRPMCSHNCVFVADSPVRSLGYGFYDSTSGLATQPLAGARKDGAAGAIKGFGKGVEGLVLKPAAGRLLGVWGLTGYTVNGIYKQIRKWFGENVENYIIASRCAQGAEECSRSTAEERADILRQ
ncbi:hypothetical protein M432DRAFT_588391 [Thermoascus aurantiacus ATCC 26904]